MSMSMGGKKGGDKKGGMIVMMDDMNMADNGKKGGI